MGFQVVERGALPLKAWKDCLRCPKFQACDEIAVLRILRPDTGRKRSRSLGPSHDRRRPVDPDPHAPLASL